MQIIYNKENIKLNYINNYVKILKKKDKLYLYNTLYNKEVIIDIADSKKNIMQDIINKLHSGIETEELLNKLSQISKNPKELYEYLLQHFIIE